MKKLIIFSLLIGMFCLLSGQTFQWGKWGVPSKIPDWKGDYDIRFFPKADGGFYHIRSQFDTKVFQTRIEADEYNAQMERTRTVRLTPPYNFVGFPSFVDLHQIGDKYYMFLDNFVKEKKLAFLYVQEVDMESGELIGEMREIAHMVALSGLRAGEFEIAFSPDGSKMLITQNESAMKKTPERISFRIFDNQFNELSFDTYRLPYPAKIATRNSPMISDKGRVYFFKEAKPEKGPRFLTLFATSANGMTLNQSTPDLGMNAIGGYKAMLDKSQNPVLIGYYQPSAKAKLVQSSAPQPYGIFVLHYDVDGNKMDEKLNEFSEFSDAQRGLNNCHLQEVIPYDGGYVVVGEWQTKPFTSPSGTSLNNEPLKFTSKQLYLSFLGKSGSMEAFVEINKHNESVNDQGRHNSCFAISHKASVYVFFNDFKYKYDGSSPGPNPLRAPIMQGYDSQGQLFETTILDGMGVGGPRDEFHLCTNEIHKFDDNTYLVKAASSIEQKAVKLTIQN